MSLSKALWTAGSLIGVQQVVKAVRRFEADDLFGLIGLKRRGSTMGTIVPTIGLVSLGAAVGAGTALLFAPTSGAALRQRLSVLASNVADKLDVSHVTDELSSTATHERDREPNGRSCAEKDST